MKNTVVKKIGYYVKRCTIVFFPYQPVCNLCSFYRVIFVVQSGKVKVVPLQTRCGPEGSRRFRFPDFHDIRHMKVVRSSALRTGRLYPQECSWYSFSLGAQSTPWYRSEGGMSLKNPVTPPEIDPGAVRLVAQRFNHYATPGPSSIRRVANDQNLWGKK